MTDQDHLDILAGEKIMGWSREHYKTQAHRKTGKRYNTTEFRWMDANGVFQWSCRWRPTERIDWAMMLWDKVKEKYSLSITWNGTFYFVTLEMLPPHAHEAGHIIIENHESLPTAITRAILKAEGVL